jgi:hypothetical protein
MQLPDNFLYSAPQQLNSSQFEIHYKRFIPLVPAINGVYEGSQDHRVQISLSLAPNEYALCQDAYLNVDALATLNYTNNPSYAGKGAIGAVATTLPLLAGEMSSINQTLFASRGNGITPGGGTASLPLECYEAGPKWRYGPFAVGRSEESINNGSLKLNQNTDSTLCNVYNVSRCQQARRHYDVENDAIEDLAGAGCDARVQAAGFNVVYNTAGTGGPGAPVVTIKNKPKNLRIPLGLISDIANCNSLVPVGLFNSYATQSWRFDFTLPRMTTTGSDGVIFPGQANDIKLPVGLQLAPTVSVVAGDGYRNVEIWMPVIRVLSPQYQEMVLSQYEKRAMTQLNGVSMPITLRLNTLNYEKYGPYPIPGNQGKMYFRLSTTQPSVRAVIGHIYKVNSFDKHYTDAGCVVDASTRRYQNFAAGQARITSIETRVGTRQLHDCVTDYDANDTNVADFVALNMRRSGGLFSPFPYWEEAAKQDHKQSDIRCNRQWGVPDAPSVYGCYNLQSFVVSFENSDHRTMSFDGSSQITGINVSQVGAIELTLGFSQVVGGSSLDGVVPVLSAGLGSSDYAIVFQTISDQVIEVAPVGMTLVTQEMLNF